MHKTNGSKTPNSYYDFTTFHVPGLPRFVETQFYQRITNISGEPGLQIIGSK